MRKQLLFPIIISVFTAYAQAQLDPSAALLLNGGQRTSEREGTVETSRYTVRPKTEARVPAKKAPVVTSHDPAPEPTPPHVAAKTAEPAIEEQAKPPVYLAARSDRRINLMEISVAPGFLYNDSSSDYFYRKYSSGAPTIAADARVWIHPGFALQASYLGTLSGHVNDSLNGSRNTPVSQQWSTAGIRSRKFFGDGLAPILVFGVDYSEYQFRVPSDAVIRAKLRTTGVQLSVESEIPATETRAWTLGFNFSPKVKHEESSNTTEFRSGSNVDSNAVGVTVGGRVQFHRTDAVFWRVSHAIEKNLFSGDATAADPSTGLTPSGTAVTNSFTQLQFGYTWGN